MGLGIAYGWPCRACYTFSRKHQEVENKHKRLTSRTKDTPWGPKGAYSAGNPQVGLLKVSE